MNPTALLVLGAVAAMWLQASRVRSQGDAQWQPAGLGVAGEAARGWSLVGAALSVLGGDPAEAQDRSDNRAEPAGQGTRQSAPRFSRIAIEPGKVARFTGSGVPGTSVSVKINGRLAGTAAVGADGSWAMSVPALGVGDHRVALARVDAPVGAAPSATGQEVRIAIPVGARSSEIVAFEERGRGETVATREPDAVGDAQVRDQAERLAREASREFDEFSRRQKEDAERQKIAQDGSARDRAGSGNGGAVSGNETGPFGAVADWLSRSSRDYYEFVVPELARKGPREANRSRVAEVPPPERRGEVAEGEGKKRALPDLNTLVARAQDWLREANRTYNDVIVAELSRRSQTTVAREEPKDAVEVAGSERRAAVEPRDVAADEAARLAKRREALDREAQDVARRAVAERQEAERRDLMTRPVDEDAARREEAERKRRLDELLAARDAEQRLAEESARADRARQEEQRQAFERAIAEQEQRAREARRAEAARKLDEARKQEELLAKLDADRRRAEEKRRRAEAERQRAEAERQAERDRQLRAEAERVAREAVERERLAAEASRQPQAEEERRVARQESETRARQDARVAAVSERARRVGELADETGFGKRRRTAAPAATAKSDKAARSKEVSLPERKSAAVQRPSSSEDEQRRRDLRINDRSGRADKVVRPAQDADLGKRRRQRAVADVPLPADPAVRREALQLASRLGGPPRRGSLKDDLDGSGAAAESRRHEQSVRRGRLAGWRGRAQTIGGTGCKDPRAGLTIRLPGTYVVARGDTLWHISRRHYRQGLLYRRIYKANRRKIRNPHWIYPCQRFWLPQR